MRQKYPCVGVGALRGFFGKTRNAFYEHQRRATAQALLDGLVRALVADIREDLPRLGTRKLYFLLLPRLGEHAPAWARITCLPCWPATACSSAAATGAW